MLNKFLKELESNLNHIVENAVVEEREACIKIVLAHGQTEGEGCYWHDNSHWRSSEEIDNTCWNIIAEEIRARVKVHPPSI